MRRSAVRIRDSAKIFLTHSPALYRLSRRPYTLGRYVARSPHEADYAVFGLFPDRLGLFLDVGANAGMSAMSFRLYRPRNPILSVEPNPFHRADLIFTGRVVRRFSFLIAAAGLEASAMSLFVPVYRGIPLTTEASLIRAEVAASPSLRARLGDRMDGPDFQVAECDVDVVPLDDLELAPDFLKLDVQGFEYEALQGLDRTLERSRPILLIETPGTRVRSWLDERRYSAFRFDPDEQRLSRSLDAATNLVFVPDEAVGGTLRVEPSG